MEFKKKNPKIYVISGKAGTGKDKIATLITKNSNLKSITISYAFYLKEYAKRVLGWDGAEETKPREFLQQVGVELIKKNIDDKLLLRRVIEDIKVYSYFYDIIIIDDARFKEEITSIKTNFNNVTSINVKSTSNRNKLTEEQQRHLTETSLDDFNDYDYVIENDLDVKTLEEKVKEIVKEKI